MFLVSFVCAGLSLTSSPEGCWIALEFSVSDNTDTCFAELRKVYPAGPLMVHQPARAVLSDVLCLFRYLNTTQVCMHVLSSFSSQLSACLLRAAWFDLEGEKHRVMDAKVFADAVDGVLRRNASVSFYMAFGGTNFAFSVRFVIACASHSFSS